VDLSEIASVCISGRDYSVRGARLRYQFLLCGLVRNDWQ